ncbi:ParA family protein [Streptomyces sp. NPDC102282]|uniref:ParA family protein n=1 Tax=Streptomyces sp. NPDC102282 TaxID=3366154 RepID=UPI0037F97A29
MARRTAILNNKGGVGKTAVAMRLAEALARRGRRVLYVEVDAQGNATRRFGVRWSEGMQTVNEAVRADSVGVVRQAIHPIGWREEYADRISLVPAWLELDDRIMEAGIPGSHLRLVKGLQGADDDFDETILDCPPSLSHLTQLALAASHQAIAVTEAEQDSIRGARRVLEFIAQKSYALHNEDLKVTGVIVTRMDTTRSVDRSQLASAREIFGDLLWEPVVPRLNVFKELDTNGSPITRATGEKAGAARATFELLADTFEKRSLTA